MDIEVDSNFGDIEAVYDATEIEEHVLEVANVMEYALYLHYKEGYYVFNPEQLDRIVREKLQSFAAGAGHYSDKVIEGALQTAAAEYVNWLVDVTGNNEKQPPLTPSQMPAEYKPGEVREAVRGGWATVTGQLAAGFRSRVDDGEVMTHDDAAPDPVRITPDKRVGYP